MVTDTNQTYHGDHFAIYTNIKPLCCMPETNIMLHINHTSVNEYIMGQIQAQKD